MANKSINTLDNASSLANADLFVIWQDSTNTAKNLTGQQFTTWLTALADGHGGIASITWTTSGTSGNGQYHNATIHYADGTTSTFQVRDGLKGNTGAQTYVHIKYSLEEPTQDSDIGDNPAPWMGIATGTSSSAPSSYTAYTWYRIRGDQGEQGYSIDTVNWVSNSSGTQYSPGSYDTYNVILNDDNATVASTFSVYNGMNGEGAVNTVDGLTPDANGDVKTTVSSVTSYGSATISGEYAALSDNQTLICSAAAFASAQMPSVSGTYQTDGVVEIHKGVSNASWIEYHGKAHFFMPVVSGSPSGVWEGVNGAVVLYDNTTGTTSETLSQSIANFVRVKVTWGSADRAYLQTDEAYTHGASEFIMPVVFGNTGGTNFVMTSMRIVFNGTGVSRDRNYTTTFTSGNVSYASSSAKIYRVEAFYN